MNRPNILWISTHDINPHLGTYAGIWPGAEQARTPNLDRLAAQGARFDRAYASAPVCAPSRSAIITGCHPTSIGTMHMRSNAVLPEEIRLLPELLREAGYYTTNNWFRDFQTEAPGTAFDDDSSTAHWRGRPEGAPFFAAFHGLITHESQIYLDSEALREATPHVADDDRCDPSAVHLPPYHPDTETFRRAWANYFDLVAEMDHWVGTILDQLEEDDLAQNTIVVFWSDHGAGFPGHKRWAGEAGLRVPLIARWPGHLTPGPVEEPVGLVSLAPTMLEMCGLEVPQWMQADALLDRTGARRPVPAGVVGGRDRMDEQEDTVRTVRDGRFRYVRNLHPDRPPMQHCRYPDALSTWVELRELAFEEATQRGSGDVADRLTAAQRTLVAPRKPAELLFDTESDPHEMIDLAGDPRHQADLERLRRMLDEWTADHGDLGTQDEAELLESWRPGGGIRQASAPWVDAAGTLQCDTAGARLGFTTLPPAPDAAPRQARLLGMASLGSWQPAAEYRGQRPAWIRAWKPGFDPSDIVHLPCRSEAEDDAEVVQPARQ
ncbi:sulfatase family protein [Brachybacterium sp.]|uniref:sulfatase family protein n=1 Tax=Brachybacterium sp. TaxID=1891286 RepID=UPI003F9329B8